MFARRLGKAAGSAALAFSFVFILTVVALAQATGGAPRHEPGRFDFYVLALSWSPSYCAAVREKTPDRLPQPQCGERPFSFVVHGLWPQYERGFPSFCAAVKVPAEYLALGTPIMVTPGDVASAFLKSNPRLSPSAMAVACDRKRLTEVRICLTKDFTFRDCPEVAQRACRRDKVAMPAVRGG